MQGDDVFVRTVNESHDSRRFTVRPPSRSAFEERERLRCDDGTDVVKCLSRERGVHLPTVPRSKSKRPMLTLRAGVGTITLAKQCSVYVCEEGELNPYTFRYRILSPARLPIPPSSRWARGR